MEKKKDSHSDKKEILIDFISKTKEGKYAKVDLESSRYLTRVDQERDDSASAISEEYYYSVT